MPSDLELFDTNPEFYKIDGMTMVREFPKEAIEKASRLEFKPGDVLSATYPKTGTVALISNFTVNVYLSSN